MIVDTDYSKGSAEALTNYMSHDQTEIRGPDGSELSDEELDRLHAKSEANEFTRQIILSPERDDLTEEELDRATRRTMTEWTADHSTTEWAYAIHEDKESPDIHVAATATKDSQDLWMDTEDIQELRDDIAADHFGDHSLDRQQDQMIEQGREDELEQEQQEQLMLGGSSDNDQEEQDSHIDDAAIVAAAGAELASLSSPETLPISIAAEAYEERRKEQQQEQQRNRRRKR